ncbi:MAG: ABC transporter ATP-binding protein [Verrucomicrobia bacterium]|nr:ABC transporter ATP-binding protein [Verrucomicrobiota bacterium]
MVCEVLKANSIDKRFDGVVALSGFSCGVREGEVLGLIGPNGAGKTTLFNVIGGFVKPERGRIVFMGSELTGKPPHKVARRGVARTFQDLRLIRRLSVMENVLLSFRKQPGEKLANVFLRPGLSTRCEKKNHDTASLLLREAGLVDRMNDSANDISYGQQKLLSLICCLAADADLLLLDEPVAGIAPQMIQQVLKIIRGLPDRGKTVMLIEHDMDAVAQVCDRVIFMDAGRKVCEGTPDEVREDPRVIEAYLT